MNIRILYSAIVILACVVTGCGSDGTGEESVSPDQVVILESNTTPYTGSNPFEKVSNFTGTTFKDVDPDVKWLSETKIKLDAMKYGEYLSQDEYSAIVQRQTKIQAKYDARNDYYEQLKADHAAIIMPHSAVALRLESFCLNLSKHSPSSGSSYSEVVPLEEHVKKIFVWNYADGKSRLGQTKLQSLIWGVQDYVHNGYAYENALSTSEREYLKEIFGSDDKVYLDQMREKYGKQVVYQSKAVGAKNVGDREARVWIKESVFSENTLKDAPPADSNTSDYFNLGNGLIGKFSSKSGYISAKLIVVNPTDKPLEFTPFEFMLQTKQSDVQLVALGVLNDYPSAIDESEEANQWLPVEDKNPNKPSCNITDQHRQRIIEQALPSAWQSVPYEANNSRLNGVVCNQYVRIVYDEVGLPFSETNTWGLPKSPYFEKIPVSEARNGDVVLWLNASSTPQIHHMGLWVENPEQHGGSSKLPFLSARTHGGKSKPGHPKFQQTVDWTNPDHFGGKYDVYRYKGAGKDGAACSVK